MGSGEGNREHNAGGMMRSEWGEGRDEGMETVAVVALSIRISQNMESWTHQCCTVQCHKYKKDQTRLRDAIMRYTAPTLSTTSAFLGLDWSSTAIGQVESIVLW